MTVEAFLEALKGLTAVPVSILEHLEALAPYMTDAQRAQVIKDFMKLNGDAMQSLQKVEKFVKKSKEKLDEAQKEYVPMAHQMEEEVERAAAVGSAEAKFQDT